MGNNDKNNGKYLYTNFFSRIGMSKHTELYHSQTNETSYTGCESTE